MASEIRGASGTGQTIYAHLTNSAGKRWNGSAFETYAVADWANYSLTMTEQSGSGVYMADFPSAITTAGSYEFYVYLQNSSSPASGDQIVGTGTVYWNGSAETDIIQGSMSGSDFLDYVLQIFKRTDKDTELYDCITDAIQELRRIYKFQESQVETTTTDTISALGDYRLDVETDFGLLAGVTIVDGTISRTLTKLSKAMFDEMYPNPQATDVSEAKPVHYCLYAGQIQLGPVPDSISYTYRVTYSKRGETISSATTSVPFTKDYRDPLRIGTLSKAYVGLDNEQAEYYRGLWEMFKNQIVVREEVNQRGRGSVVYNGI